MDAVADPQHCDHAEHAAGVAEITGSDTSFHPAFLDIPAVNRVLVGSSVFRSQRRKRNERLYEEPIIDLSLP